MSVSCASQLYRNIRRRAKVLLMFALFVGLCFALANKRPKGLLYDPFSKKLPPKEKVLLAKQQQEQAEKMTSLARQQMDETEEANTVVVDTTTPEVFESRDIATKPFPHLSETKKEQISRLRHVNQVCRRYQGQGKDHDDDDEERPPSTAWMSGSIEASSKSRYQYCPILEAGSTFLKRIFYSIRTKNNIKNPYGISIATAVADKPRDEPRLSSDKTEGVEDLTSVMFVREPYARLLSSYVNKLYAPNPYFWFAVGKPIVSKYRPKQEGWSHVSVTIATCGHDVTFEEFVRYVVDSAEGKNESKLNEHFTPASKHCRPCEVSYTMLGKVETFTSDLAFMLNSLGHPLDDETLKEWERRRAEDAITEAASDHWLRRASIRKCMSWFESLQRLWRKLQLSGLILFEDIFPWREDEVGFPEPSMSKFIKIVMREHEKVDPKDLKIQRQETLIRAFADIPNDVLKKFAELFFLDFEMFQYPPYPDWIYNEDLVEKHRNDIFYDVFDLTTV